MENHIIQKAKPKKDTPLGKPAAIVGIGASAGGLEAIEAFFKAAPVDSGIAYVVVQHLSPDYKSLMVELLSRKTDIPVHRAEDGMVVQANHIYLIPPKKNLTIFHGKLLLEDQKPRRRGQSAGGYFPAFTGRRPGRASGRHHSLWHRERRHTRCSRHQGVGRFGHGSGRGQRQV